MLQWLRQQFAPDPWEKGGNTYVSRFREEFDRIATALSQSGYQIQTRFNDEKRCAEFFEVCTDRVLIEVWVHGEFGSPYQVIVTSAAPLATSTEAFFKPLLPDSWLGPAVLFKVRTTPKK